jgi:hypothetical protein
MTCLKCYYFRSVARDRKVQRDIEDVLDRKDLKAVLDRKDLKAVLDRKDHKDQ